MMTDVSGKTGRPRRMNAWQPGSSCGGGVIGAWCDGHVEAMSQHEDRLDCVPLRLHDAVMDAIRLSEDLQAFKDDPVFAGVGFRPGGTPYDWLRRAGFPGHGVVVRISPGGWASDFSTLAYLSIST